MLTTGLTSTLRNRDKEEIKPCVNLALASSLQDLVETRNKIEEPKTTLVNGSHTKPPNSYVNMKQYMKVIGL